MKKLLAILGVIFLLNGCSIVGPDQRGISVSMGTMNPEPLTPGFYLRFPVVRSITKLNIRIQKSELESSAASKDMQEVKTNFAINWRIDGTKVTDVYKTIGDEDNVLTNVISPTLSEVLKASTAKKTVEEILTKRHELKTEVDSEMKSRMVKYGVIIEDINIVNVQFSHDFSQAVERKQIAEQRAKQAEFEAVKAEKDAVAEVNRAKGQAEAQKLLRTSTSPELLKLKYLEKWDGKLPQIMSGASNGLMLNVNDLSK